MAGRFLPGPRVTADSAGRRSCQGWPEATAERLGLDREEACGHFPGSEGQLVRLVGSAGVMNPCRCSVSGGGFVTGGGAVRRGAAVGCTPRPAEFRG